MRGRRSGSGAARVLGTALAALTACSSGGSGGGFVAATPFSAQLLPLQIPGTDDGAGDVAFARGGDALLVGGTDDDSTDDTILRISRTSGLAEELAADVTGNTAILVSIAVDPRTGIVFVGDQQGRVFEIDGDGGSTEVHDTGVGPVNGMAFAPSGFGDLGRRLVVASESDGILALDPDPEDPDPIGIEPSATYADLAFLDGVLYALDRAAGQVVTVAADGAVESFAMGFTVPAALAADAVNRQLLVVDTGADPAVLSAVTVPEEPEQGEDPEDPTVIPLGRFAFDPASGLGFDGVRNLLLPTGDLAGSGLTLRGVFLPRFDPDLFSPSFPILGTTEGNGALTFDLEGRLVGTGNLVGGQGQASANLLFRVRRSDGLLSFPEQDLGDAAGGEALWASALDPTTGTLYVGTSRGNIFAVNALGAPRFTTLPAAPPEPGEEEGEVLEDITGLAIAPASFDPVLGGRLVAVTAAVDPASGGRIYAIDLAQPDPGTQVLVTETGGDHDLTGHDLTGLVFASDGTLYVLDQDAGKIVTVAPDGGLGLLTQDLVLPDGIAIDESGGRLFVAEARLAPESDRLRAVSLANGAVEDLSDDFDFAGGYGPTGMVFDGLGSLFLLTTDETAVAPARVEVFSVFPPAP